MKKTNNNEVFKFINILLFPLSITLLIKYGFSSTGLTLSGFLIILYTIYKFK